MDTSTPEPKRSRRRTGDVFKQPTKHLRRGKACLNCRFLKIKCDGVKPTCGQCIRVPKDDPCEYTDGPSRTILLQQNVAQLQARIRELEQSKSTSPQPSIGVDYPSQYLSCSSTASSSGESSSSRFHSPAPPPPYYSPPSLVEVLPQTQTVFHSSLDVEVMNDIMLPEIFLPHAAQFGFFLNADRFRKTVQNQPSFSDSPSPSPWKALLSTVNLWGVHLSESPIGPSSPREADLLQSALSHTAMQISSGLQSFQTIQLIQAKALLAAYFLRKNQFMDSDYHISGAVSLCLSLGLHKLNYSRSTHSKTPCGVMGAGTEDHVEIEERIRGFWTVFALQRHILMVQQPSSCAFGNLNSCQEITTPWPIRIGDSVSPPPESLGTLRDFWCETDIGSSNFAAGVSDLDMYVKATILLQKAVYYLTKIENNSESDFNSLYHGCISLNDLISRFRISLPPLISLLQEYSIASDDIEPHKRQSIQTLVTAHAITSCAQLKVRQAMAACGIEPSDPDTALPCGGGGMIDLALGILQSYYTLGSSGCGPFNPVSSSLCGMAYEFILREQARVEFQSVGLYWLERDLPGLPLPHRCQGVPSSEKKSRILVVVEKSKSIMNYLSTACPSINYQFEKVTKLYDDHVPKSIGP
ncbi:hypothetical protein E1B28_000015 [Marasmius oreades]|uniref:Zn(2)-C6 fungal-type domain-containing protein n=1 Tax=Marasmius oreades TaxID=181124 RepID=A0A9P8ADW7_9AGAR|nr:uncharacterized protein E1B28_000015 [Marasmius oreades]KAG7098039.1 hypothetical protein E1B28_000015 [Marasmius oreades]